jgi:hypothetical protein
MAAIACHGSEFVVTGKCRISAMHPESREIAVCRRAGAGPRKFNNERQFERVVQPSRISSFADEASNRKPKDERPLDSVRDSTATTGLAAGASITRAHFGSVLVVEKIRQVQHIVGVCSSTLQNRDTQGGF